MDFDRLGMQFPVIALNARKWFCKQIDMQLWRHRKYHDIDDEQIMLLKKWRQKDESSEFFLSEVLMHCNTSVTGCNYTAYVM